MEGTVKIPLEEYIRLNELSKLIENEKIFRVDRDYCGGKATFFKIEVSEYFTELEQKIESLERIESAYLRELLEKKELIKRLEDTCSGWKEMWDKQQNKSFWQKLFS